MVENEHQELIDRIAALEQKRMEFDLDVARISQVFQDVALAAEEVGEIFRQTWGNVFKISPGLISVLTGKPLDGWRGQYEGLIEWGSRLQHDGLLDDPVIRMAYQREIWSHIIRFPLRIANRWRKV